MTRFKENQPLNAQNLNNLKLDFIDFIDYIYYAETHLPYFSSDPIYLEMLNETKRAILRSIHIIMDLENKNYEDEDYIDLIDYITNTYGVLKANEILPEVFSGDDYDEWVEAFKIVAEETYQEVEFEVL